MRRKYEKNLVCTWEGCEKRFAFKSGIDAHYLTHLNMRNFPCTYKGCQFAFYNTTDLNEHLKRHDEKIFSCNQDGCSKSFYTKKELQRHLKYHTKEKNYKCTREECDKSFVTKHELNRHVSRHVGIKMYPCEYKGCTQSFVTKDDLTEHIKRKHKERKRIIHCKIEGCSKTYFCNRGLLQHVKHFHSAKTVPCVVQGCSRMFSTKSELKLHLLFHNGIRNYTCEYPNCGKSFYCISHAKRHFKSFHTPEGIARHKREEERVRKFLISHNFKFESEVHIDFRCMKDNEDHHFARLDILMQNEKGSIIIEVDEDQHRFGEYSVSCDMERMARIIETTALAGNTLPILFIRYNPGSYKVNDEKQKTPKKDREARLLSLLKEFTFPERHVSIVYMYYDSTNGVPDVSQHEHYHPQMRECIITFQ